MKNLLFGAFVMLMGTFAFAGTIDYSFNDDNNEKAMTIKMSAPELVVDCLLKITFEYEDGTKETVYYLIRGKSCKEVFKEAEESTEVA